MKKRNSSIELLRIISIVLIIVVHMDYLVFGTPTPDIIRINPIHNFFKILIENISIICVDVFVLISGWFGVRPNLKSIGGLIFQCVFFGVTIYCSLLLLNLVPFTLIGILKAIFHLPHFIWCYLIMVLFAPILNTWVLNISKREFKIFLIFFFSISFLVGWTSVLDDFYGGNSVISFIGLYLLARYLRLHIDIGKFKVRYLFLLYIGILLMETIVVWGLAIIGTYDHLSNVAINMSTAYIAPNVIMLSVLLILIFVKFDYYNRFINWIAISAFSSVLLHGNALFFPDKWSVFIRAIYDNNNIYVFFTLSLIIIIIIMLVSVLLDKIRLNLWTLLIYPLIKKAIKLL